MPNEITSSDDMIDSRDLLERIEELQELLANEASDEDTAIKVTGHVRDMSEEEGELKSLLAFKTNISDDCFDNQETLIAKTYFTDYINKRLLRNAQRNE